MRFSHNNIAEAAMELTIAASVLVSYTVHIACSVVWLSHGAYLR